MKLSLNDNRLGSFNRIQGVCSKGILPRSSGGTLDLGSMGMRSGSFDGTLDLDSKGSRSGRFNGARDLRSKGILPRRSNDTLYLGSNGSRSISSSINGVRKLEKKTQKNSMFENLDDETLKKLRDALGDASGKKKYKKLDQLQLRFPDLKGVSPSFFSRVDSVYKERNRRPFCIQNLDELVFLKLYDALIRSDFNSLDELIKKHHKLMGVTQSDLSLLERRLDGCFSDSFRTDVIEHLNSCGIKELIFDFDDTLTTIHSNKVFEVSILFSKPSVVQRKIHTPKNFISLDIIRLLYWLKKEGFKLSIASRQERSVVLTLLGEFFLSWVPVFASSKEKTAKIRSMGPQSIWIDDSPKATFSELGRIDDDSPLYTKKCFMKVPPEQLSSRMFGNLLCLNQLIVPLCKPPVIHSIIKK